MIEPGRASLKKIAVIGRGTAGSLAAAGVTHALADDEYELHHIYDSRIPIIGVGEGSWPSLVRRLHELSKLPYETIQQRLNATRKYGVAFEGWGARNQNFTHFFTPQLVSYAYHLSADLLADILQQGTRARHIDANVKDITRQDRAALIEFEDGQSETYDLVFDARGFPKELREEQHVDISFIPTNTAIIRRCPSLFQTKVSETMRQPTYTRAVARPFGWVFVIPLTVHTSYGYIFNRHLTNLQDVEADFDEFLNTDGVTNFEQRAVLQFPNFVHREIYDGVIARVGNTAAFMEPLEATAIVATQMQIELVLHMRLNRSVDMLENDAKTVNKFLMNNILCYGLFVGWHYSCGSKYDTEFWRLARDHVWQSHREVLAKVVPASTALSKFDEMFDLLRQPVIPSSDWNRLCAVPVTSYAQLTEGLGFAL